MAISTDDGVGVGVGEGEDMSRMISNGAEGRVLRSYSFALLVEQTGDLRRWAQHRRIESESTVTTYMVGYDLGKPGRDYDGLAEYLKSFGSYWHNLDSTWIIVSGDTAASIRDGASDFLDSSDKLLVAQISAPGAWRGFKDSSSQWLMDNL